MFYITRKTPDDNIQYLRVLTPGIGRWEIDIHRGTGFDSQSEALSHVEHHMGEERHGVVQVVQVQERHAEPTLQQARDAVAELCLLQYGSDPINVDAVIVKYAAMRAQRIALDKELSDKIPPDPFSP